MLTRATARGWGDGLSKIVTVLAAFVVLIGAAWVVWIMPGGGVRFGNQVETDNLAKTTQMQNDAVIKRLDGIDAALRETNKNLNQVPLMNQTLADHTEHLHALDGRDTAIEQSLILQNNKLSVLVPGWYEGYVPPQVRQPQGRTLR